MSCFIILCRDCILLWHISLSPLLSFLCSALRSFVLFLARNTRDRHKTRSQVLTAQLRRLLLLKQRPKLVRRRHSFNWSLSYCASCVLFIYATSICPHTSRIVVLVALMTSTTSYPCLRPFVYGSAEDLLSERLKSLPITSFSLCHCRFLIVPACWGGFFRLLFVSDQ
jgi:hypothetical protein